MPYLLNGLYLLLLVVVSPWLAWKALWTGKYRRGLGQKWTGSAPLLSPDKPRIWLHAVSVGEVLLLKPLIAQLHSKYPQWDLVLSTTTNTGFDVAQKTYPNLTLFYFPLDFTWSVQRALQRVNPRLILLAELELWPNFIQAAHRLGIPLAVVNGRMSPRSHRGYRRIRGFMRRLLSKLSLLAVQNQAYAERLLDLGANPQSIRVTGSMKYDGLAGDRNNPQTRHLARLLGLEPVPNQEKPLVWVVGSTQAPEEEGALRIYQRARQEFPHLRLILVPRHKERFEEVAEILQGSKLPFVRRSQLQGQVVQREAIVLVDTLGELSFVWGLADVAFVGGSLSQRGGQNMIEPAAYGAAVTFGPHVWNFQETVDRLLENQAALQVGDSTAWEASTLRLFRDATTRHTLGAQARQFVLSQFGATERTMELLRPFLAESQRVPEAA
jgi:3-deoxy-D-manno-octulosonic-acid transferase